MSPLDRAFENWYSDSSAGEFADEFVFGNLVSDDTVDMRLWAATHTIDIPDHDGLWGDAIHGPVAGNANA